MDYISHIRKDILLNKEVLHVIVQNNGGVHVPQDGIGNMFPLAEGKEVTEIGIERLSAHIFGEDSISFHDGLAQAEGRIYVIDVRLLTLLVTLSVFKTNIDMANVH